MYFTLLFVQSADPSTARVVFTVFSQYMVDLIYKLQSIMFVFFFIVLVLSVLRFYELERPYDAGKLLEKLLEVQTRYTDARFLLANVYYVTSRYDDAVEQYELIERSDTSKAKKQQAKLNKERILAELYELR